MSNRFEIKIGEFEEENIVDNLNGKIICEISDMCKKMNELYDENYILKKRNKSLEEYNDKLLRKPLLTDILPNVAEIININNELEKENEQLKQQLNYIQNSISEHIKHQKTELGQKALKEIIEDYNEWLLKDYR